MKARVTDAVKKHEPVRVFLVVGLLESEWGGVEDGESTLLDSDIADKCDDTQVVAEKFILFV